MRGRKPTPNHLKLITGNPGRRPVAADFAPPLAEFPSPPGHLNDDAKAEWQRIGRELYALGLLTGIDTSCLAAYCHSFAIWKQALEALKLMAKGDPITKGLMICTTNGNAIQNPLVGTANKAASDMVRYAAEFGMSPSARARVTAGIATPKNKFADLTGVRKA